jgi:predicted RNase H-like HicB family nuclease
MQYQARLSIGRQEDGLWRVEVPDLHGAWVDEPTLDRALFEIQEVIAMAIDEYLERGWPLPPAVTLLTDEPTGAELPIVLGEHRILRSKPRGGGVKSLPA